DPSLLLLAGIGQIIEVNGLAVAIDPGRDQAEAVEMGTCRLMAFGQVQTRGLFVEGNGDLPLAAGPGGRILQRPVMGRAVRIDMRRGARNVTPTTSVSAIGRCEKEPL